MTKCVGIVVDYLQKMAHRELSGVSIQQSARKTKVSNQWSG